MDKGDRLYDRVGKTDLFQPSELLGKVGFRVSGHSSPDALIPLHWRLSTLDDVPKAEMALTPNLKDVYGNWHPVLDRVIEVGLTYNPLTKTFQKDTWLTENLAICNEHVVGGEIIKNIKALVRGNIKLGQADLDVDLLAPLDKTVTEAANAQVKLNFKDWFLATNVTLDKINQPSIKAGYEDKSLSIILENTDGLNTDQGNWGLLVTKCVDANTIVGMQSNLKTGQFSVGMENVLSDHTELKLNLSSADVINLEYTKQFPNVTTSLALQANGLIKSGQANDLKFGVGVELDL